MFIKVGVSTLFVLCLTGWVGSASALILGAVWALVFGMGFQAQAIKKAQTTLLQASIIGLGAGMNIVEILRQGASSIPITLAALSIILFAGLGLSRILGLSPHLGWLLSSGTAICGGSAITAVSSVLKSNEEDTSIALGVVFLLNAFALLIFPSFGHWLGLNQHEFGIFSALAIHDTSSVVGAASAYGPEALSIATTTKLVRALWIIPLTLLVAAVQKRSSDGQKAAFPKFILFFLLMSAAVTWLPSVGVSRSFFDFIFLTARKTLIAAIFLIGLGISLKSLKRMGPKAMTAGLSLWIFSIGLSYSITVYFGQ